MRPEKPPSPSPRGSSVTPDQLENLLAIARKHGASYLAIGDVVMRLSETGLAAAPGAGEPKVLVDDHADSMAVRYGTMTLEQAEERRRARIVAKEAKRQADAPPLPDPWDAWRTQKAPDMFDAEVTHRG